MAELVLAWDGAPALKLGMLDWYGAFEVDGLCMLDWGGALGLELKLCMLAWYGAPGVAEATLVLLVYKQYTLILNIKKQLFHTHVHILPY